MNNDRQELDVSDNMQPEQAKDKKDVPDNIGEDQDATATTSGDQEVELPDIVVVGW
jgi:hypothetical protein